MAERKYFSEFGINAYTDWVMLTQQDKLADVDQTDIRPHIYAIGRRPRVSIDPAKVVFTETDVTGIFKIQRGQIFESVPFKTRNMLGTSHVSFESDYPYTEYRIHDSSGKIIASGKSALLVATINPQFSEFLDIEVLYIGQSFGTIGERDAIDRLKNHKTLQGIYAEALHRSPDKEIWICLFNFEYTLLTLLDGISKQYSVTNEENSDHIQRVLSTPISIQQKINFTEAALIKYFQPEYNSIFKDTFPHPGHSTYSECYKLDINTVCVTLDTEQIWARLWSAHVEPEWYHFCQFPLHSTAERKRMFEFP